MGHMVSRVRVVAATVVVLLVAGLGAAAGEEAPPSGFADTAGNAHEANIDYVVWWGIAQGVTATEYRPAAPVTRAQMGSFLARMISHGPTPLPANPPSAFDDTAGSPHAANIDALAAAGVVRGIAERTYGPHLTVTREQMTSFLVRAWEYATGQPLAASGDRFTDIATSAHRDNINKAAAAGFASGTTATTFSPSLPVRRDQMASFIARTVRRMVDHGHATHPDAKPVEREWLKDLGLVLTPTDVGLDPFDFGVSDIKVAVLPDGSFAAVLASHAPYGAGPARFHMLESDDLVAWTEIATFDMEAMLEAGFYIGSLLALPDGTLKMIGVSDREGDPVLSSSSTDGGRSWTADPGPLLSAADFDHDVRLMSAATIERPEGGWRMYINANNCADTDLYGRDNCSGEAMENMATGVESVYSAVSDDLATWTLEPGVRHRAHAETASVHHLDAWIDDAGRVRLTGHMKWNPPWIFPEGSPQPEDGVTLSQAVPSGALMELVSDDGLTFPLTSYRDYRFPIADPQVVRGPEGSFFLLAGSQGQDEIVERDDGEFDQRGGIRLFELVTIGWELDPIIPFPVVLQAPQPDQFDTHPFLSCFRIDVRGSGTVRFEVRADGWGFTQGSAPPELYEVIPPVVEAPGVVHIKRSDPPDYPDRYWPSNVVAIDADGVSWFVQPFPMQEPAWEGEVHGHDFDSFPCPP